MRDKLGKVKLRKEGNDLVIVDDTDDGYENAIILTLGHPMSDYPTEYFQWYGEKIVELINKEVSKNVEG